MPGVRSRRAGRLSTFGVALATVVGLVMSTAPATAHPAHAKRSASNQYAVATVNVGGKERVARWDPCARDITYRINRRSIRGGKKRWTSSMLPPYTASGHGGWQYYTWDGGESGRLTRGFVLLSTTEEGRPGFGAGHVRGKTLMHEIGHALGLDHVADPDQLMHPVMPRRGKARLNTGDRAGLRLVGHGYGSCQPHDPNAARHQRDLTR